MYDGSETTHSETSITLKDDQTILNKFRIIINLIARENLLNEELQISKDIFYLYTNTHANKTRNNRSTQQSTTGNKSVKSLMTSAMV